MLDQIYAQLLAFVCSEQIFIAILGVLSIELVNSSDERLQKYAPIFGLLSQPFWFYMAYNTNSWGVFILSILYTRAWCKGFYNRWILKELKDD